MRALALACATVLACVAASARAFADTPGYTPIGPPASLAAFAFAANGTVYGTVGAGFGDIVPSNPALWRSTDHGRTWSMRYRAPQGAQLIVRAVSPADPDVVYVQLGIPGRSDRFERVDARSGLAVPLPFVRFLGADAAGAAYGLTYGPVTPERLQTYAVVRCPRGADQCTQGAATLDAWYAIVDPLSVGVLATTTRPLAGQQVETSTDGGATWALGAIVSATGCNCRLAFAGPSPRTLYNIGGGVLSVSHDAGLTWAATYPAPAGDGPIVGSHPAVALSDNGGQPRLQSLSYTADEGATYTTVPLAVPGGVVGVDPTDAAHVLLAQADDRSAQSWDSGHTTTDLADARFGIVGLGYAQTTGAGNVIYATLGDTIWSSRDLGANWTRTQLPAGSHPQDVLVSRDDPRSAYVRAAVAGVLEGMRTRDGGATWQAIASPLAAEIVAIAPGSPDHVFTAAAESADGGETWAPRAGACPLAAVVDASSATGKRIVCAAYGPDGAIASTSPVTSATSSGIFASPDAPGALAIATWDLLGDVGADGAWTSLLAPTDVFGPPLPPGSNGVAAWPAKGGTTFVATDSTTGATWVREGAGRWWRLQVSGRNATLAALLDSTHVVVTTANRQSTTALQYAATPLAVLDLAQPAVDPPHVEKQPGGLTCVVPWSRADADTTAYAWLRDGVVLRTATRLQYQSTALDRGHDLTCRATATTAWGSVAVTSTLAYTVAGARVPPPRPHLTGAPLVGSRLTCSARTAVTWLRGGRAVTGAHGRTYRVRPGDRGVTIACRTRLSDGTVVESPSARIAGTSGA